MVGFCIECGGLTEVIFRDNSSFCSTCKLRQERNQKKLKAEKEEKEKNEVEIRNISQSENSGYNLDVLDELIQPKDLCQKIVPASAREWEFCGCEVTRYGVSKIDRNSEHQGFLLKIDAGKFIWYCSRECAVKDNQK